MILKHKFKLIATAVLLAASVVSCDKKLDLEPRQSIDASNALTTPDDVEAAVVGCYSIMGGGALYGTNLLLVPELQGSYYPDPEQYISWTGTFLGHREIARKIMRSNNGEAARIWNAAYSAINMANVVLDALDIVTDADQKNQLEGEALFVRGILYFELVRLYGLPWGATPGNTSPGVVIKTTPTKTEAEAFLRTPRSTVAQVYTQVISDLTAAADKLPIDNGTRADRYTALAFLAKVYMQQGNYDDALTAADEVINAVDDFGNPKYEMNAAVRAVFDNKNTRESIFEIQQNDQNNAGTANDGMATFFASLVGIGRADVRISAAFRNTYNPADRRRNEWYYVSVPPAPRSGNIYCAKWSSFSQNLPVVRIAEMFLIRAECNARAGTTFGATPQDDLAEIRNPVRTGLAIITNPTVNDILAERKLELACEGFRIHEIKRLQQSWGADPMAPTYVWNQDELVFPIPVAEVQATEGVVTQNPGY